MKCTEKPLVREIREKQYIETVKRRGSLKGTCEPVPHFDLSPTLYDAMSYSEVMATIEALSDCDLLSFPYPMQTLRFNIEDYACSDGWGKSNFREPTDMFITAHISNPVIFTKADTAISMDPTILCEQSDGNAFYLDLHNNEMEFLKRRGEIVDAPKDEQSTKLTRLYRDATNISARLLIAALATKNVSKQTGYNTRAAKGRGSGHFRGGDGIIRLSRTAVDVPTEYTGTGRRMKFHLRRGHVHTFLTGPGRQTPVKKFVSSVFVNSDLREDGATPAPTYQV